jgi:hypothetical protein
MWKTVSSCLLWCLWRKRTNISFEDRERTLVKLKSFFFNTLYIWAVAFVAPLVLSFLDFFVLFLLLPVCFSCILLVYLGCTFRF